MKTLNKLFGESPFEHLVEHAQKVHACVNLIRPIADAILAGDMERLRDLQGEMSKVEYEADLIKDAIREKLLKSFFLPVAREDLINFIRQLDRMGDDCEDFAVVATFRPLTIPEDLRPDFLALVDKVVAVSEGLLNVAGDVAKLQKECFGGLGAEKVLEAINVVCHMEWESDKLSRALARRYYSIEGMDILTIIIFEKLCLSLTGIADHAENVGKNLRLMIARR